MAIVACQQWNALARMLTGTENDLRARMPVYVAVGIVHVLTTANVSDDVLGTCLEWSTFRIAVKAWMPSAGYSTHAAVDAAIEECEPFQLQDGSRMSVIDAVTCAEAAI